MVGKYPKTKRNRDQASLPLNRSVAHILLRILLLDGDFEIDKINKH